MATNADSKTMAIVAEIFAAFPPNYFRFTSGKRTVAQNAAVGGVTNSYHVTGQAADFVPNNGRYPESDLNKIGQIVARHGYEVIKHNVKTGLHYHIEPAPKGSTVTPIITADQVPAILNNPLTTNEMGTGESVIFYAGIGLLVLMLVRR